MPITKSAKKALRVSFRRKAINLVKKNKIKKILKQERELVAQKKVEEAKKLIPELYKTLDKAAKSGLIKKNTADRKKSRIAQLINKNLKSA